MLDKIVKSAQELAPMVITAVIVLVIGIIVSKLLLRLFANIFARSKADPMAHKFLLSILRVVLYVVVIVITLSTLKVDMTSIIALLSVAGLAVSLAVQNSLTNLTGGIIILFSRPFKAGDFIEFDGISGTVESLTMLQTKLITPDNKAIHVPNGQVSSAKLINYSEQSRRRLDLSFSISYQDDFEKAKEIIRQVVDSKKEYTIPDQEPTIRVSALSAHSVDIVCRVWVVPAHYWDLNFDLIEEVKLAFDKAGITIPFEQLDVHIAK